MIPHEEKIKEGHNEKRKLERRMIMKTKLVKSITSYLLFACALVSLVAAMALGPSATGGGAPTGQVSAGHMLGGCNRGPSDGLETSVGNLPPKPIMQGFRSNENARRFTPS